MKKLVKKAIEGDKNAFMQLIELNKQSMYKVSISYLRNNEDVADVIQDTIITCYEKLGTLRDIKYFKTWLIRILINKCNAILNKRKEEIAIEEAMDMRNNTTHLENIEFNEIIDSLDEKYRTIVILYYVEGFKVSEISNILEINIATIKTRLSRARKKLAKEFDTKIILDKEGHGCV